MALVDKTYTLDIHYETAGVSFYPGIAASGKQLVVKRSILKPNFLYAIANKALCNLSGIVPTCGHVS